MDQTRSIFVRFIHGVEPKTFKGINEGKTPYIDLKLTDQVYVQPEADSIRGVFDD
jgi:hypothetical protein